MTIHLTELVSKLREIFEEDYVDVDEVTKLLQSYKSNRADWSKFAIFDINKFVTNVNKCLIDGLIFRYTRNLVDFGNGKYNLMILCWGPGMGSSIHDHTDAHCFVKILEGNLQETKYEWPVGEEDHPLLVKEKTLFKTNEVSYMSDELGLHRMENLSHSDGAVSLHLYIPPYQTCNAFDERTGRKSKCQVTFYTKFGKKVDYRGSREGKTDVVPYTVALPEYPSAIRKSPI